MELTDIAKLCKNEIKLVGILTEFHIDSYVKNEVGVIKYKGVVNCNNAFIQIKGITTSFDDTFASFINDFQNEIVNQKVFIIGELNSQHGINVTYITLSQQDEYFEGEINCIPYDKDYVIIVNNQGHTVLKFCLDYGVNYMCKISLVLNPLIVNNRVIKIDDKPPIIWMECACNFNDQVPRELIDQALEEHQIYLDMIRQMKEGR